MPKVPSSIIDAAQATLIAEGLTSKDIADKSLQLLAEQLYWAGYREAQATTMQALIEDTENALDVDTFIITATAEEVLARVMTKVIWSMNNRLDTQQLTELTRLVVETSNEYGVTPQRIH